MPQDESKGGACFLPFLKARAPARKFFMENEEKGQQKTITFYGDRLLVVEFPSGYSISLPALCLALDLNFSGQLQRLQRSQELATHLHQCLIHTPGGQQRVWCLKATGIDPWLSGLRLRKVKPTTTEKVQRYRNELLGTIGTFAVEDEPPLPALHHTKERSQPSSPLPTEGTDEDQKRKMLAIITNMQPPYQIGTHITTTNSQIDQSIREASFATDEWEQNLYMTSNHLEVYLGTRQVPLPITEAQTKLQQLGGSTVLTARVVLGLWNLRRNDERFSLNGSIGIRLDEILAWRGMQKHERPILPGSALTRQDGYRTEHRQQIIHDLELLATCCVRGTVTGTIRGKKKRIYVDGPYLRHSVVSIETTHGAEPIGFFVSPGDWIHTFDSSAFHAEIDQRIFRLNPQNQQHELRIALYLVESWRQRALQAQSDGLFRMQDLLAASMIEIDTAHMSRFVTRIERALTALWQQGILGEEPHPQNEIDKQQNRWGKEWLESYWHLVPPTTLVERYAEWESTLLPLSEQSTD